MATLRAIVAKQLKKLDVTQKELAEKAGLNATYINEILSGKKLRIQRRFVPTLAHALQVEPDDLYKHSAGRKKGRTASSTASASPRTVIQANSPETQAIAFNKMPALQSNEDFDPNRHVPLFIEQIFRNIRHGHQDPPKFRPFVWPEFLGPSEGCYAMTAKAALDDTLSPLWVLLVAPNRSIKLGDAFVGEFSFVFGASYLHLYKMQDATELSFMVTDIDGGNPKSFPRKALLRCHKVVGFLEQPE